MVAFWFDRFQLPIDGAYSFKLSENSRVSAQTPSATSVI